jgi:flagellum-specific peptidoglycan hydrolase FlgJ
MGTYYSEYQLALESEQKIRAVREGVIHSIKQIRQYQVDYKKDIELLYDLADKEKLVRTQTFVKQLIQMEVDQIRQKQDLNSRLIMAKATTAMRLQQSILGLPYER